MLTYLTATSVTKDVESDFDVFKNQSIRWMKKHFCKKRKKQP
jgi:hypothetical protein